MSAAFFLGVDVGTTGCKSAVFDGDGNMLATAYREYGIVCDEPLKAEQDPERVFSLLLETMGEAVRGAGVDAVRAVCASVQGDAVIPVDDEYRVLHPAVLGMDYRSHAQCEAYAEKYDPWALYLCTGQPLHPINMLCKAMWLRENRREAFDRAARLWTYSEFVVQRLGGEPKMDITMASRSMGFDIVAGDWSGPILSQTGIPREKLSPVCDCGSPLGTMGKTIAEQIGLKNRPVIISGGHDQPLCAIGAGVVTPGMAVDSTGTAEVLSAAYAKPKLNRRMFNGGYSCYHHAVAPLYFTFAHMQVGGILQRWYRDTLAAEDVAAAAAANEDFYAYAHRQCAAEPSGVLVLPHFNGSGTPRCDINSKGAIVGLTLSTTRAEILKGILDSLSYELRINMEAMSDAGVDIREIVAVGGGARSELWLQTKANVLNRRIRTLKCKEAGCLGAAILAACGVGEWSDVQTAVRHMVHYDRDCVPQSRAVSDYEQKYRIYAQLYDRLEPISHAL